MCKGQNNPQNMRYKAEQSTSTLFNSKVVHIVD